ncbi:MAG: sugar transferase [Clostridia bacterium]
MIYDKFLKRLLDIVFSLLSIIILSPAILLISIIVRIKLGKPVVFLQGRPGRDERIFTIYKFRTMTNITDEEGRLLSPEERLTRVGAFLRTFGLDELPELWNILKGDMSFIGPRPLMERYLPLYTPRQRKRHSVRPGLTGLAQAKGRNAVGWQERFELDLEYIERMSFGMDLRILLMTIRMIISGYGNGPEGPSVMEPFEGCPDKPKKGIQQGNQ